MHPDLVTGLVLLLVSLAGLGYTSRLPSEAALFPRLVLGTMAVLALAQVLRTVRRRRPPSLPRQSVVHPRRLLVALALSLAYVIGVQLLGYFTTTILWVPTTAWCLGYRNRTVTLVTAVAYVLVTFVLFDRVFERPLPAERLGEIFR